MTSSMASSRAGETDEQTYARAMRDPEVQQIMADPAFQSILQQAQQDPKSLQQHMMQNADVRKKVEVLVRAGYVLRRHSVSPSWDLVLTPLTPAASSRLARAKRSLPSPLCLTPLATSALAVPLRTLSASPPALTSPQSVVRSVCTSPLPSHQVPSPSQESTAFADSLGALGANLARKVLGTDGFCRAGGVGNQTRGARQAGREETGKAAAPPAHPRRPACTPPAASG